MNPAVVIIPVCNSPRLSLQAIWSACNQWGVDPLHLLIIDQDSNQETQDAIAVAQDGWKEVTARPPTFVNPTIHVWRHAPTLPSLAATWNTALDFAWAIGASDALVVNNDVELPPNYYATLRRELDRRSLIFLSGIGIDTWKVMEDDYDGGELQLHPDFSAYLMTEQCHHLQRFDEQFIPAYCEDVDYHRHLFLANFGHLIGKINIPFLHHSSGTLKDMADPQARMRLEYQIAHGSRAYFEKKWGGPVNEETYHKPFSRFPVEGVTTGDLRRVAEHRERVSHYVDQCVYKQEQIHGPNRSAESQAP